MSFKVLYASYDEESSYLFLVLVGQQLSTVGVDPPDAAIRSELDHLATLIDENLLVPLSDFNYHISYVNVLETELWAASHCVQNME